jgi:hypothetical protein
LHSGCELSGFFQRGNALMSIPHLLYQFPEQDEQLCFMPTLLLGSRFCKDIAFRERNLCAESFSRHGMAANCRSLGRGFT